MPRVGILMGGADNSNMRPRLAAFQEAFRQLGWLEGRNVQFDIRWGNNDGERLAVLARDMVQLRPDVILAAPTNALLPLRKQTSSIPIVFVGVSDPLGQGIVESLARPTGNLTGFSNLEFSLIGKWLQVLKEIAPGVMRVAVMISTSNPSSAGWYRMFNTVASSFGIEPISAPITTRADVESAIEATPAVQMAVLSCPGTLSSKFHPIAG
jgi:putative ABC transport system substrate-binding protein